MANSDEVRPVLITRRDYMAIRGLPPVLRGQKHVAAGAVERLASGWEAGEHLAVIDRDTLLAHKTPSPKSNGAKAKKRHGRARGR